MSELPSDMRDPAARHDAVDDADRRQRLRRMRNLMAAATSMLLPLALAIYALWGVIPASVALATTAAVGAWIGLFVLAFRSGLNLRFRDPSLTTQQILAAIVTLAAAMYHAPPARDALMVFYCMALLFGAFRFGRQRMLVLAAVAIAVHGGMLIAWHRAHPLAGIESSLVAMVVLMLVLPWFAIMGGYVNHLRSGILEGNRRLKSALSRIEEIAVRDELTGVYNRRFIMETLQREISRVQRSAGTFSVCLLDLDHFKTVNDSYGHAAGDVVLKRFARIASEALREVDLLGRYGGEEFLIVLPGADVNGGVACGERIRAGLEKCTWPELKDERRVTVTGGVATWKQGDTAFSILARADEALYSGKNAGRNRVVHID